MDETPPRIDQINIVVSDMDAAVGFYRLLGLRVPDTMASWMPHHREIESVAEGLDAELDSRASVWTWDQGFPKGRSGVVVSVAVGSRQAVDETYERVVAAGYRTQQAPHDAFWGSRFAVVEDPDGTAIGLMSPRDDAHRSIPPDPRTF